MTGRAKFLRTWGPDFDQKGGGRGEGGKGTGGAGLFVCGNYKYFLWGRGRNVAGGGRGRGGRALGRIDVGIGYTRGARSRRWCGWWGEGGGVGDGGGWELQQRHGRL